MSLKSCYSLRRARASGVSLLEVLVVGIIIGLIAVLVVPRVAPAANMEGEKSLRALLQALRTQITLYRAQHNGVAPGYPNGDTFSMPTYEAFIAQMSQYTNADGETSKTRTVEFTYGPYLKAMPANPLNSSADIRFVDTAEYTKLIPQGLQGWIYQPSTGTIVANSPDMDIQGVPYTDY